MRTLPLHEETATHANSSSKPRFIKQLSLILAATGLMLFGHAAPLSADQVPNACRSDNHLILSGHCTDGAFDLSSFYVSPTGTAVAGVAHVNSRQGDDLFEYVQNGLLGASLARSTTERNGNPLKDVLWKDDMGPRGDVDSSDDHHHDKGDDGEENDNGHHVSVPEPGNLVLVAIGLSALAVVRKDSWFSGRPS